MLVGSAEEAVVADDVTVAIDRGVGEGQRVQVFDGARRGRADGRDNHGRPALVLRGVRRAAVV